MDERKQLAQKASITVESHGINFAPRIHCAYDDCSGIFQLWAERCEKLIVFEHPSDEKIKRTHLHLGMWGCDIKEEAFKRIWRKANGPDLKGNEDWSFKRKEGNLCDFDMSGSKVFITYCTKGQYAAKFIKNISLAEVDEARSKWVDRTPDPKKAKSQKDKTKEFYSICEKVLETAKATHGVYENKLVPSEFGSQTLMSKEVIVNPGKVYDILLKELKKNRIMTEINQLTRFMTTILREDLNQGDRIKEKVFQRIFPEH